LRLPWGDRQIKRQFADRNLIGHRGLLSVPNKMSSARVERALREGKRLPPENLLL
jgi:hypothetical protein